MFCPGTSTLHDGRILVSGGQTNILTSVYDPRNDTWSIGKRMNIGRGYQSQLTLSDGRVFVFGGSWNGGIGGKDGEVYTEFRNGSSVWTRKPGITTIPSCLTNDTQGLYRSDSHTWLFEHTDGRIFQAGPSKRMHWITLAGNGTISPTVYVSWCWYREIDFLETRSPIRTFKGSEGTTLTRWSGERCTTI
jgi:galactose oxidase